MCCSLSLKVDRETLVDRNPANQGIRQKRLKTGIDTLS